MKRAVVNPVLVSESVADSIGCATADLNRLRKNKDQPIFEAAYHVLLAVGRAIQEV